MSPHIVLSLVSQSLIHSVNYIVLRSGEFRSIHQSQFSIFYILIFFMPLMYVFSINLELFTARQAMASPPVVVHPRESVRHLANLLIDTKHGGYPMVPRSDSPGKENKFMGIITRYLSNMYMPIISLNLHVLSCLNA